MKVKRILAVSCLLIATAAGGTWQYVANKFDAAARAQIQQFESFGIHLDGVEISEHLFRVSFQKATFTPAPGLADLVLSAFPEPTSQPTQQIQSTQPAQPGVSAPVAAQDPSADSRKAVMTFFSKPFRLEMSHKASITFNPLLKQTTMESDINGQTLIKWGDFEETFIQKATEGAQSSKIVLTHNEMSDTNKGLLEFLKSIVSVQMDCGAGSISTKNNQVFGETKAQHMEAKWGVSAEQKGSVSFDYTCPGYKIDPSGIIELIRKNIPLDPATDFQLMLYKKPLESKNINFHFAGDLDMKKTMELLSADKPAADKPAVPFNVALIPDGKIDMKSAAETPLVAHEVSFSTEKALNRFTLNTDAKIKMSDNKSLILENLFNQAQLLLKTMGSSLVLDKKSFVSSFPDIISVDPTNVSFKVDAQIAEPYTLNGFTFQIKNPTTGLDIQAKTDKDRFTSDIIFTDAKKVLQISGQLGQWASSQFGGAKPEVKAMVDTMLPQYIQTASSVLEKIGEAKAGTSETHFRIEGNFKTFADVKINGKKLEECIMIVLAAGLTGTPPQGAGH